jgi:hypothetical protein
MSKTIFASLLIFASWIAQPAYSAQTNPQSARKFDEFGDALVTDIKARADNFAVELLNYPTAKGFIIVYRSRRDPPGINFRYADRIKQYLVMTRGITEDRVVTVDGGEADCLIHELWIVPPNTTPTPRSDAYKRNFDDIHSARKFDEIPISEEMGMIEGAVEGYAEALRTEPRSRAYLIAYAQYYVDRGSFEERGKRVHYQNVYLDRPDSAWKTLKEVRHSLVRMFRIPASRIRLVNGGYRQQPAIELWIVPRGEHAPISTPNAFPPKARQRRK